MTSSLYFNPSCSKCRTAWSILEEAGIEATQVRYLESAPTHADLLDLMRMLGIDSPREMMRTSEAEYEELGLAGADDAALLSAISAHPNLLQRPIFVYRGKAVIARPAERVHELLDSTEAADSE